jgi:NitT/TauT family transport system permease protein
MIRRALGPVLFFAALLVAWHLAVVLGDWPPMLFPGPLDVASYLAGGLRDGSILASALVTVRRLLIGFLAGVLLGLPAGFLIARSRFCARTLGVVALGMQTLPSVCWVPLALVWFGQTEGAMFFVVIMGTVWSIMLATRNGLLAVPPIYARAARTMGAGPLHALIYVMLPASLPQLLGGMKQGWAFAWRSLMAAEIYVTILTGFGLGHLLHYGRELHAMDQVLGVMLLIVLIGLIVDQLLFAPLEAALHRRWGTGG